MLVTRWRWHYTKVEILSLSLPSQDMAHESHVGRRPIGKPQLVAPGLCHWLWPCSHCTTIRCPCSLPGKTLIRTTRRFSANVITNLSTRHRNMPTGISMIQRWPSCQWHQLTCSTGNARWHRWTGAYTSVSQWPPEVGSYAKIACHGKTCTDLQISQNYAKIMLHNFTVIWWDYLLHPFNGLFSKTTWVNRHQKCRTILDFNEARDDRVAVASAVPYANHLHLAADR